MNTCRRCKHWKIGWTEDGVHIGDCQCVMVCQPNYGLTVEQRTMTADGVYTCDEGGGTGELMTGEEFGCIHWKGKND
jgi:hypothetical protein